MSDDLLGGALRLSPIFRELRAEHLNGGTPAEGHSYSAEHKTGSAPSISVVINTLNEERNIAHAIMSVRSWVNEVVVVDMESDDQTAEIARSLGAKLFSYPRVINFDAARVAGVEHATCDWILLLDADEVIPFQLSRRLLGVAATNEADAFSIPRLNYFSGEPLYNAGFGPEQDRQLRFYRKGSVSLNDVLHSHIQAKSGTRVVKMSYRPGTCIVHFSYKDSAQFVSKLNKYTSLTAWQRRDSARWKDRSLVVASSVEFLKRYIWKRGFLSGAPGLYFSFMMAAYRMTQAFKLREIQLRCSEESATARYQEIARGIVQEYESVGNASDLASTESRGRQSHD